MPVRKLITCLLPLLLPVAASAAVVCTGTTTITCTGGPAASISAPGDTSSGTLFGKATPYGTVITVPAGSGTVTGVSVRLNGVASNGVAGSLTQNMGLVLVSPTGANLELMRFVGDGSPASNETLSNVIINIADANATAMPSPVTAFGGTGTTFNFKPGSYSNGAAATYQSPAPASPNHAATLGSSTLTGVFSGVAASGAWTLYLGDRSNLDSVSYTSWDLILTVSLTATG